MDKFIELVKGIGIAVTVSGLIAGLLTYFTSATFFASLFLVWLALWVNGVVAAWEDIQPGGLDNLDNLPIGELIEGNPKKYLLYSIMGWLVVGSLGIYCGVNGY